MNNGLFTYLAALLLFGSNGIIAAAIALPSSDIVLLRTFLGVFSLVTILAITQRHTLQAPSRPPRSRSSDPFGSRTGRQLDFSVPRVSDDWRRRLLAAVLLRSHHRHGPLTAYLWRKTDRRQMLMYGKEASNRKQEIDRQHYTIPNQRPKDKHCGKI